MTRTHWHDKKFELSRRKKVRVLLNTYSRFVILVSRKKKEILQEFVFGRIFFLTSFQPLKVDHGTAEAAQSMREFLTPPPVCSLSTAVDDWKTEQSLRLGPSLILTTTTAAAAGLETGGTAAKTARGWACPEPGKPGPRCSTAAAGTLGDPSLVVLGPGCIRGKSTTGSASMATYTRLQCKEQTLGMISLFIDHPALFTSITIDQSHLTVFLKSFHTNLLYEGKDFTLVLMLKNVKKFFLSFIN